MLLNFITDIDAPSGYASFARGFGRSLIEAGVDVVVSNNKHDKVSIKLDPWWSHYLKIPPKGKPDIHMHVETPEFYRPTTHVPCVGYTFWETDRLPSARIGESTGLPASFDWIGQMNKMTEVWTGATFATEAFSSSGVTSKLRTIGVPIKTIQGDKELPIKGVVVDHTGKTIPRKDRKIVIAAMGQFTHRKNFEDLIIAVCSEFRNKEVTLLLKTYGSVQGNPKEEEKIRQRVKMYRSLIGWKDVPNIILLQNTLTDEQMHMFYRSVDIFVTTSRGEGFGIPPAQAMAYGIPTVATNWSAMRDYVSPETGWPIKYQMEPVYGLPWIPWYRPDQEWARVDIMDLKKTLRMIYENIGTEEVQAVARQGAEFIRKNYSSAAIGQLGKAYLEDCLSS